MRKKQQERPIHRQKLEVPLVVSEQLLRVLLGELNIIRVSVLPKLVAERE